MLLLQRMPGLGVDQGESETRSFIDLSFSEACRAGDVLQFIENPYDPAVVPANAECSAGALGTSLAAMKARDRGYGSGKLTAAAERAVSMGSNYLATDVALAAIEAGVELTTSIPITGVLVRELDLGSGAPGAARVRFSECLFGEIGLDPDATSESLPRFSGCFIATVDGRVSRDDLPKQVFDECEIETFGIGADTTKDVLQLPIAMGVRVLITVLKKLFERKGRGRRENALYRGLDHRTRRFVPEVLQLIKGHGIASPTRMGTDTVWLPDRASLVRVGRIIASPSSQEDALVKAAADLT